MSIDISDLRNLPVADKLKLVTELWDDIAAISGPVVIPPEILAETIRRSDELNTDPTLAINDEELWRRVNG